MESEYKKPINTIQCPNCNKFGHEYKKCKEPITSWGIILVRIQDEDIKINHSKHGPSHDITNYIGVKVNSAKDITAFNQYSEHIRFLLVQRKHSLGYVEFIRGRYIPSNIEGIIFLFRQMTEEEISNIGSKTFDELWNDFWHIDVKKQLYNKKEYQESKQRFTQLKDVQNVELGLDFYVAKVKPLYKILEWGFPKGRKIKGETSQECATREFCEETGYGKEDIQIIESVKPIVENVTGTNGVSYRHIYYLAELVVNKMPSINIISDAHNVEIGDIGFYTRDEATQLIRAYHLEKKEIIKVTFLYYLDMILNLTVTMADPPVRESSEKDESYEVQSNWDLGQDGF